MEALPGPLTPMPGGWVQMALLSDEQVDAALEQVEGQWKEIARLFVKSIRRMEIDDRTAHIAGEHEWAAHAGEEAYLWFNDRQCFGQQTLPLPEDKKYRVELIDVWNMTRQVLREDASGSTLLQLPGEEGLAVLATRVG